MEQLEEECMTLKMKLTYNMWTDMTNYLSIMNDYLSE